MANSVQIFSGLNTEKRTSSKVLRPPGGGSSDIFGLNEPEPTVKGSPPPPEQESCAPVAEAVVSEAAPVKPEVNGNSEPVVPVAEAPATPAETPAPASPVKVDTEVVNGVSDDLKAATIKADVEPVAAPPVEPKSTPQKTEQGDVKQSPLPSNEARAAANAQLTADLNAAAAASAESSAVAAHAKVAQRQSSIDVGTKSNDRPMVDPSSGRVMGAPQARTGRVPPGGFSSGGFW